MSRSALAREGARILMRQLAALVLLAVLLAAIVAPLSTHAQTQNTFNGVIEGRVVNGTSDGNEIGSVPLSLLVFRRMTQEGELFGQSDGQGRFRFEGLEEHSDMRYFVQAGYRDVAYRSAAIEILPGTRPFTKVTVWEPTTSDADVLIDRASIAFPTVDGSVGLIGVLELVTFVNNGDRTYVGDLFDDPQNGGAVRISLPGNALEVSLGHGFGPDGFITVPGGVINKAPLLPGPSELVYAYAIPYVGSTVVLVQRYFYTARDVTVLMPDHIGNIRSDQLEFVGPVDIDGESATLFTTSDLPPGQLFELQLTELPLFADLSSSGLGLDTALRYTAVVALGVIAIGAVALALTRRTGFEQPAVESDLNMLTKERSDLVHSLATLDAAFGSGHIAKEQYEHQRYASKRRLIDVALLLEEEAPGRSPLEAGS